MGLALKYIIYIHDHYILTSWIIIISMLLIIPAPITILLSLIIITLFFKSTLDDDEVNKLIDKMRDELQDA